MNAEELSRALEAALLRPSARRRRDRRALRPGGRSLRAPPWSCSRPGCARARARSAGATSRVCAAIAYPFGAEPTRAKVGGRRAGAARRRRRRRGRGAIPALVAGRAAPRAADDLAASCARASPPTGAAGLRARGARDVLPGRDRHEARRRGRGARRLRLAVTSTGAGPGGATTEAVELLRAALPPEVAVKAAGGSAARGRRASLRGGRDAHRHDIGRFDRSTRRVPAPSARPARPRSLQ